MDKVNTYCNYIRIMFEQHLGIFSLAFDCFSFGVIHHTCIAYQVKNERHFNFGFPLFATMILFSSNLIFCLDNST